MMFPPEKREKRVAFWLKIVAALLAAILVYCIGSDVVQYRMSHSDTSRHSVSDQSNAI
jgi:hypothetical protein